jgi:hypothetical protein
VASESLAKMPKSALRFLLLELLVNEPDGESAFREVQDRRGCRSAVGPEFTRTPPLDASLPPAFHRLLPGGDSRWSPVCVIGRWPHEIKRREPEKEDAIFRKSWFVRRRRRPSASAYFRERFDSIRSSPSNPEARNGEGTPVEARSKVAG